MCWSILNTLNKVSKSLSESLCKNLMRSQISIEDFQACLKQVWKSLEVVYISPILLWASKKSETCITQVFKSRQEIYED